MAKFGYNLLALNTDKLFEEHSIEEIVEIGKLLDAEIERKRVELRSMVGDRYKDVLTASDAIRNMKTISQGIVENIERITETCVDLIGGQSAGFGAKAAVTDDKETIEERSLIIQIRLAIFMNEEIWIALDQDDNLKASQFYLLAQHIHIGLSLFPQKYLDKLLVLHQIKANLLTLKGIIFERIRSKLQCVQITATETSNNLNALMLLENQSIDELLRIFIENRKAALDTVVNTSHSSVRVQISAMLRCLITTIQLLHDCFILCCKESRKGLIWQQLDSIVDEAAPPTLSHIQLPPTPLNAYIPDIIKQFRPKCKSITTDSVTEAKSILQLWRQATQLTVERGVVNSLKLVTNVKGLYIIREEALKIELPQEWDVICAETGLPDQFNVWQYFFQKLLSERAKELITIKINAILGDLQNDLATILINNKKNDDNNDNNQIFVFDDSIDLNLTWTEDIDDVSRVENSHTGLSMKTLGYSSTIVSLCKKFDGKYFDLLVDVSQYLYGCEFTALTITNFDKLKKKKYVDRDELENHLKIECTNHSTQVTVFLQNCLKQSSKQSNMFVLKSLISARFLQAITNLCPHFHRCCSINGRDDEWNEICLDFHVASLQFWENWVNQCVQSTDEALSREIDAITPCNMISILIRWDTREIQEQTDENVFKSQIKVPLKPSLLIDNILNKLNNEICSIRPHTLPKQIHLQFIERNVKIILNQYEKLLVLDNNDLSELNQNQSLQFLFDIKFLTTLCIPRDDNVALLIDQSQRICDKLRNRIDPFDLDVFYEYLQSNVKRAVIQSQVSFGCLLPTSNQLANLGVLERGSSSINKEYEKDSSLIALSCPSTNTWFPLLPITAPNKHKTSTISSSTSASSSREQSNKKVADTDDDDVTTDDDGKKQHHHKKMTQSSKKSSSLHDATSMRSSAAALFGGLTTDWFS